MTQEKLNEAFDKCQKSLSDKVSEKFFKLFLLTRKREWRLMKWQSFHFLSQSNILHVCYTKFL